MIVIALLTQVGSGDCLRWLVCAGAAWLVSRASPYMQPSRSPSRIECPRRQPDDLWCSRRRHPTCRGSSKLPQESR